MSTTTTEITISLPRPDGTTASAQFALEYDSDPEFGAWAIGCLSVPDLGRSFRAGGGEIHTAESALHANHCDGLQPDTHPEIHWPGAVDAGDLATYTVRVYDDGRVYGEQYGEIEPLLDALGFALLPDACECPDLDYGDEAAVVAYEARVEAAIDARIDAAREIIDALDAAAVDLHARHDG